ncbi:hypothetical protein Ahu01nite_098890 [Winogradskya humida]|uniref:Uncharacterized protein n=1 Tax=Winogradskya humida TaxID=113566 RepID=A0ABQ4A7D9_9ACTN|nr:hypothetical protein Ahu01nite_098890 [Actinoplanes humidus]
MVASEVSHQVTVPDTEAGSETEPAPDPVSELHALSAASDAMTATVAIPRFMIIP